MAIDSTTTITATALPSSFDDVRAQFGPETQRQLAEHQREQHNRENAGAELDHWLTTWTGRLAPEALKTMIEGAADRVRQQQAEEQRRAREQARRASK